MKTLRIFLAIATLGLSSTLLANSYQLSCSMYTDLMQTNLSNRTQIIAKLGQAGVSEQEKAAYLQSIVRLANEFQSLSRGFNSTCIPRSQRIDVSCESFDQLIESQYAAQRGFQDVIAQTADTAKRQALYGQQDALVTQLNALLESRFAKCNR